MYTLIGSVEEFMHLTAEEEQLNIHSRFTLESVPNNPALKEAYWFKLRGQEGHMWSLARHFSVNRTVL